MRVGCHTYARIPLERFLEESRELTQRCRDLVGFCEDEDWECPYYFNSELGEEVFGPYPFGLDCGIRVGSGIGVCEYYGVKNAYDIALKKIAIAEATDLPEDPSPSEEF